MTKRDLAFNIALRIITECLKTTLLNGIPILVFASDCLRCEAAILNLAKKYAKPDHNYQYTSQKEFTVILLGGKTLAPRTYYGIFTDFRQCMSITQLH